MFTTLIDTAEKQVEVVKAVVATEERLRVIIAAVQETPSLAEGQLNTSIVEICDHTADLTDWRVYSHCAAVTRLYALLERFIEDLIGEWLRQVPTIWPKYGDLAEDLRRKHIYGTGRLLTRIDQRRHRKLKVEDVVKGFAEAMAGSQPSYALLPEAFLEREQNFRLEEIVKIFANVGIGNVAQWLNSHRRMKKYIGELKNGSSSVETELSDFVNYRNDAAHGAVDEILAPDSLRQLADFVLLVMNVLEEALTAHVVVSSQSVGKMQSCGVVTEVFKQANAVVAKVSNTHIRSGQNILLMGDMFCPTRQIKSIQIDGKDVTEVQVQEEIEIGLGIGTDLPEGARVIVL